MPWITTESYFSENEPLEPLKMPPKGKGEASNQTTDHHNFWLQICLLFSGCKNGCFLKRWYPQNTPKWSFLVGKPMVVGYHHFRKPPNHISVWHCFWHIQDLLSKVTCWIHWKDCNLATFRTRIFASSLEGMMNQDVCEMVQVCRLFFFEGEIDFEQWFLICFNWNFTNHSFKDELWHQNGNTPTYFLNTGGALGFCWLMFDISFPVVPFGRRWLHRTKAGSLTFFLLRQDVGLQDGDTVTAVAQTVHVAATQDLWINKNLEFGWDEWEFQCSIISWNKRLFV